MIRGLLDRFLGTTRSDPLAPYLRTIERVPGAEPHLEYRRTPQRSAALVGRVVIEAPDAEQTLTAVLAACVDAAEVSGADLRRVAVYFVAETTVDGPPFGPEALGLPARPSLAEVRDLLPR